MKRVALFAAALLFAYGPSRAADSPTSIQELDADWQAEATAHLHVQRSIQAILKELNDARVKIKQLEADNEALKHPSEDSDKGAP